MPSLATAFVCLAFVLGHNEANLIGRTWLILVQYQWRRIIDNWRSSLIIEVNSFTPLLFYPRSCLEGVFVFLCTFAIVLFAIKDSTPISLSSCQWNQSKDYSSDASMYWLCGKSLIYLPSLCHRAPLLFRKYENTTKTLTPVHWVTRSFIVTGTSHTSQYSKHRPSAVNTHSPNVH